MTRMTRNITEIISAILCVIRVIRVLLHRIFYQHPKKSPDLFKLSSDLARLDPLMREEFTRNREESQKTFKETREELGTSFSQNRRMKLHSADGCI